MDFTTNNTNPPASPARLAMAGVGFTKGGTSFFYYPFVSFVPFVVIFASLKLSA
jgi:hypothetical protein